MLKPTLLAGVTFGVLAGLPYLDVVNFCTCCSLVVICGFAASYLYSRRCVNAGAEFRPGTGALVGLIAGVFFAFSTHLVGTLFKALVGQPGFRALLELFQAIPEIPPESQDLIGQALEEMEESGIDVVAAILGMFGWILVGAVFSTVGGLIGGAVFKVSPPPPAPAPQPADLGS
jgi:hypothetical protein